MALKLAEHVITVNAVAPGDTATPMNYMPHELEAARIDRPVIPAGRSGRAGEVAEAIAYLARLGASYTTGASIVVDGEGPAPVIS